MNLDLWFSTPIWSQELDFDADTVKAKCFAMREQDAGAVKSNKGGWQSREFQFGDIEEFAELKHQLELNLNRVCVKIHPKFRCRLDNAWININNSSDYNTMHTHPGSALSGCVYIDVDDGAGKIKFLNGNLQIHYPINGFGSSLFSDMVEYQPKNKLVLLFPSWIPHEVAESTNSNKERISIAFNVNQIAPGNVA